MPAACPMALTCAVPVAAAWASARCRAFRARARLNRGTYHSANSPMHTPATQVQIHHRSSSGSWSRRISKITSATAHPAVPMTVTCRSLASSGGGAGRLGGVTWPD